MNKENIIKILENILTIDGKGRPVKARLMLSLIEEAPTLELLTALREVGERKFM
jgi:hypothetical protein